MTHLTTPRYSIRALQAFVAAYDSGTITDASPRLGMPQSTVSRHISELEGRLGQRLFERSRTGLEPTPHGGALYPRALAILKSLEQLADFVEGEVLSSPIKILSFRRLAKTLVTPAIAAVRRRHPEACFNVDLRSRRDLAQGRSSGGHDVMIMAMASSSDDNPDKIGSVPLALTAS